MNRSSIGCFMLLGCLVGCDSPPPKPLICPDPAKQGQRKKLLDDLASRDIVRSLRFSHRNGGRGVVGPAWYALDYESKESFASLCAAYLLCEHYDKQESYTLRLLDWRTNEQVAYLLTDSRLGSEFKVNR